MVILGVDPGSLRTGWGVVETDGRRHRALDHGVLRPSPRSPLPDKLHFLHRALAELILRYSPDVLAVEDLFHAVNARSALVLGHVRGVVLLAGASAGLPVEAFPPATVKLQVTGSGRADKTQVAFMVTRLLDLPAQAEPGDASDALAVALCHAVTACGPAGLRRPARMSGEPA